MTGSMTSYQIVVFTHQHSISGKIFLRDQRLSDFLNDRREKKVLLRDASVARLENPGKVLEMTLMSLIPKSGIVLAFEPPQKVVLPPRFLKHPKKRYGVFLILDGMEVRGQVHSPGSLDMLQILVDAGDSFLPITQATVAIGANPNFLLRQDAVMVNSQFIRLIGEMEPKQPAEPRQQLPIGD